jgi:signal transduction histidine kinase
MTIRKRLIISNILMTIIPIIVSVATVVACVFILNAISDGAVINTLQAKRELAVAGEEESSTRIIVFVVFIFMSFCAVMFFFSRLLSHLVIKRIEQPLEMLSYGASQISRGDLDHKITYMENDEFKPVCEAFNNMAVRLKASVEEVQKSEQNRKELLASISHDLRSPLTSIKAFAEGLLDGVANTLESRQEYLQIIKQKTDDINNMVSQLFYYSKMDMGNYPTHPELLNVTDEVRDFVSASQEDYMAKGLLVEITGTLSGGTIFADPLQLRSVFTNILDNSAKYKGKDNARALVSCAKDNDVIRIAFEDNGSGVLEDELIKLFDVFYRSDSSRSSPHQGSGLGLAIVSKALERMNGKIYAENIRTGGLRMVVEIPIAHLDEQIK